jgi:hypothetical protein
MNLSKASLMLRVAVANAISTSSLAQGGFQFLFGAYTFGLSRLALPWVEVAQT